MLEIEGGKAITSILPHLSSSVPKPLQDLGEQLPWGCALAMIASWEGGPLAVLWADVEGNLAMSERETAKLFPTVAKKYQHLQSQRSP